MRDQHANVCCVMGLGGWKCEKRGPLIVALGACFLLVCICLWDLGNVFFPVAFYERNMKICELFHPFVCAFVCGWWRVPVNANLWNASVALAGCQSAEKSDPGTLERTWARSSILCLHWCNSGCFHCDFPDVCQCLSAKLLVLRRLMLRTNFFWFDDVIYSYYSYFIESSWLRAQTLQTVGVPNS